MDLKLGRIMRRTMMRRMTSTRQPMPFQLEIGGSLDSTGQILVLKKYV